jgi:transcriptional regulator with XRE-family HTH domain
MGRATRLHPKRLGEKLLTIRQKIDGGLSQNEMLKKLGLDDALERDRISKYERGTLIAPWYVLLRYSEVANMYLEALLKDDINLPENLPCNVKSEGIKVELD